MPTRPLWPVKPSPSPAAFAAASILRPICTPFGVFMIKSVPAARAKIYTEGGSSMSDMSNVTVPENPEPDDAEEVQDSEDGEEAGGGDAEERADGDDAEEEESA